MARALCTGVCKFKSRIKNRFAKRKKAFHLKKWGGGKVFGVTKLVRNPKFSSKFLKPDGLWFLPFSQNVIVIEREIEIFNFPLKLLISH